MFYDNTKELEHIAELEEQLADAQRALDVEREKVKDLNRMYRLSIAERNKLNAGIDELALEIDSKDSLIETLQAQAKQLDRTLADVYQQRDGLQAQLRRVEGERDDEKTAYKKLSERWNKDSLDLQAKDAEIEFVNKTAADFQALWREACDQREQKDAEIAAWKLELGRMRANHPENGCYAALPKLRSQVDTLTHTNARLREALKTIEAIICDKKLCGHFLAEEIREQTQQALADTEGQEGA